MKVDKLRRLFDALDTSAQRNQQTQQNNNAQAQVEASKGESSEAVRLSSNLRTEGLEVVDARQRKIQALKAQVEEGSYDPPTRAVAEKFALEVL